MRVGTGRVVGKPSSLMPNQAVTEANRGRRRSQGLDRRHVRVTCREHSIYMLLQCLGLCLKIPAAATYLDGALFQSR